MTTEQLYCFCGGPENVVETPSKSELFCQAMWEWDWKWQYIETSFVKLSKKSHTWNWHSYGSDILHNKQDCIIFCHFCMFFLTCADNTSNWACVASFVSKWSLWALTQCWLHSIAFNLINPGVSRTMAILSHSGNFMSPPAVQLSAHHICIIHIPGFTTHIPPLAIVVELHSSSTLTGPLRQLHITWKWQYMNLQSNFGVCFYLCTFLVKVVITWKKKLLW